MTCGLCKEGVAEYEIVFQHASVNACAKCTKKKAGALPK